MSETMTLQQMVHSGDPELNKKAQEFLLQGKPADFIPGIEEEENPADSVLPEENQDPAPAEEGLQPIGQEDGAPVDPSAPAPEGGEAAEEEKKFFNFKYRGKTVSLDDEDGFLGRNDLKGLKMARAHAQAYIADLEEQNNDLRAIVAQNKQQPAPAAPAPQPQVEVNQPAEMPTPPSPPQLGKDPALWSEDESASFVQYQEDLATYNLGISEYLKGRSAMSPDVQKRLDEQQQLIDSLLEGTRKNDEEAYQSKLWGDIETFRDAHDEYKTVKKPIHTLHKEVDDWMGKLALAAGYRLPYTASDIDRQNYENTKRVVAQRYMNGEQELIETGVTPPAGYDEYFKLAELMQTRDRLIEQGELGHKSDLHQAWLHVKDRSGDLDQGVQSVEQNARKQGANAVLNAMKGHQQNDAQNLPDDVSMKPDQATPQGYTNEEIRKLMTLSGAELADNPDLRKRKSEMLDWLQKNGGI